MHRRFKFFIILCYDALVAACCLFLAIALRYDFQLPPQMNLLPHAISYATLCFIGFYFAGIHRYVPHYTNARDLMHITNTILICVITAGFLLAIFTRLIDFPRSVFIILPLLQIAASGTPRLLIRIWHDRRFRKKLT